MKSIKNLTRRDFMATASLWCNQPGVGRLRPVAELGIGHDPRMITIEDVQVPRFSEIKANWV